jgi:hypothetical protein
MTNDIDLLKGDRSDPFQPRWRLRGIAAGVVISLSFWLMVIGIID